MTEASCLNSRHRGRSTRDLAVLLIPAATLLTVLCVPFAAVGRHDANNARVYTADGRAPPEELSRRFGTLSAVHGWEESLVHVYPDDPGLAIRAWHTVRHGEALWIIAGIHGEEPAGPNAIARALDSIVDLAASGVPVVLIPLGNPKAYRNNWRYPNTAERDWRKGGYSVGDAEHLLPSLDDGTRPATASRCGSSRVSMARNPRARMQLRARSTASSTSPPPACRSC